jgi:hypothetical protein
LYEFTIDDGDKEECSEEAGAVYGSVGCLQGRSTRCAEASQGVCCTCAAICTQDTVSVELKGANEEDMLTSFA